MKNNIHELSVELILLGGGTNSKSDNNKELQDKINDLKKQLEEAKKNKGNSNPKKTTLEEIAKVNKSSGKASNDFQDIKDIISGKK